MPDLGHQTCAMCPKMCRYACPVARATASDAVHPTGIGAAVVAAATGRLSGPEAGRVVYECTMCGACTAVCELDQQTPSWIRRAREDAVRRGDAPAIVAEVARRGRETGSPYGADVAAILATLPSGTRDADVVYVPSCTAVARVPEVARAVASVLEAAGVGFRVEHPGCCGGVFADLGLTDLAAQLEGHMREAVGGAERVVTDGPLCAARIGATPFASFAAELLAAGRLRVRRGALRAAYHDPCTLGRRGGVYEPPRALVEACVDELVELPRSREGSLCSGGGAGLPATDPEVSRALAAERAEEARTAGAELLVSACPQCRWQFSRAGMRALDVAELLADSL